MLDQWQAGRRLWISLLLLGPGVRRVVGADHVQAVAGQRPAQGVAVLAALDRRVALEQMAEAGVVAVVEQQVVDADFRGDAFLAQRLVLEQGQFARCG